jgi:SPP1 gp7 family putative phage head morphogenesis protein
MDVIMDMHKAIEKAIAEGETLAIFQGRMKDIMAARGWEGLTPWHLDTIFRNNVQTAYNVGRYRQMIDMEDRFPYWEYDAVNDSRTRPSHASLDGKIFASNHPFWDTWYPPNGHNCRCGVNPVHKYVVEEEGLKIETEDPIDIAPDPGFDHNPAKEPWEPDLSKYPPELRKQFESEKP